MSRILIVDDEPRILLLMKGLLKANGYEVETAKDGAAALEIVKAGVVDIVVTDLRMQPMDGMELFREVRAASPDIPVILLTAYASVETAIDALKSGIFDYLTKPFKVEDMLACLKRAEEKIAKSDMEDYEFEYSKNSDYPINSLSFVAAKDASSHTITLDCVLYGDDDDVKATVAVKIGKGALNSLPGYVRDFGYHKPYILCDKITYQVAGQRCRQRGQLLPAHHRCGSH